ncbi:MAG: ABC transporter ATP-binding protein/permease [Desulfobacterales bacterium]|nr:ABC transporter ATP-binding protein/permease [Desulfobacterales bacterium]
MPTDYGDFEEARLGKAYDFSLLGRLGPLARPHRRLLAGSVALVLLITLLDLALPLLTKIAIDRYIVPGREAAARNRPEEPAGGRRLVIDLADPAAAAAAAKYPELIAVREGAAEIAYADLPQLEPADLALLRGGDLAGLMGVTLLFVLMSAAGFALNFAQALVMEATGQRIMHDLRLQLFAHVQDLALEFFTRHPVGRLVTRLTSDVQNMYELFTSFVSFLFKDLVLLAGIAAVMLVLNWRLALVTFAVIPVVVAASILFSRRARDIFRILRVQVAEINSRFAETIGGMRVIQLFGREADNHRRFAALNHENYLAGMRQIRVLAVFMPLIEVLAVLSLALIIWYGGERVLEQSLSLGALVAFTAYIRMFFRPLRDLAEKYNILQNAMASAERIFQVLDNRTRLPRPPAEAAGLGEIQSLGFDRVDFAYVAGETVLRSVSFELIRGQTLAVVGPTGAGKSSLINLVPRLYDPTAGAVLLNGRDLRTLPAAAFRDKLAMVMQEPLLFSGTIRRNIFEGAPAADPDRVAAVIAAANLERLVARLPQGLDTELGEGGSLVSSGERQLIAIARAFARNPQLILFDEATSAIDSQTERLVQEALSRLMQQRTALVVAHRLSTVRHADRILVMNRGRIIESGSHPELMALKGFYYRLHQIEPGAAPAPGE